MKISGLKVMESAAGFYIGRSYFDGEVDLPYSRESGYFQTREQAQLELNEETLMSFEEWCDANADEINIELAENGADRELDFDSEREFETRYQKYLDGFDD